MKLLWFQTYYLSTTNLVIIALGMLWNVSSDLEVSCTVSSSPKVTVSWWWLHILLFEVGTVNLGYVGATTTVFQCCQICLEFHLGIISYNNGYDLFERQFLVLVKGEVGLSRGCILLGSIKGMIRLAAPELESGSNMNPKTWIQVLLIMVTGGLSQ